MGKHDIALPTIHPLSRDPDGFTWLKNGNLEIYLDEFTWLKNGNLGDLFR